MSSRNEDSERGQCQYIVPRKKRHCRMFVPSGKKFCAEHMVDSGMDSDRIPCPLDPKHNCSKVKLEKHLKVCPAKPKPSKYSTPNANVTKLVTDLPFYDSKPSTIASLGDFELQATIERIQAFYEEQQIDRLIKKCVLNHQVVEEAIQADQSLGCSALKHLTQNSSLLGHLERSGVFGKTEAFVEFGSGRGMLTYWLAKHAGDRAKFLLIDKASHRHKFDNRLRNEDPECQTERIRADIKDLVLDSIPSLSGLQMAGVSKHLCGAATDFALQCMGNMEKNLDAIMIALCCHHRCEWQYFVGQQYLIDKFGLKSVNEFKILCGLTSWATCGSGKPRSSQENRPKPTQDVTSVGRYDRLGLSQSRRELIGRQAKRILDVARCQFVRDHCCLDAKLFYYIDSDISLENVVLLAT